MKIIDKIISKQENIYSGGNPTVVFIGDSVTQGCFELYKKTNGSVETIFEEQYSYVSKFKKLMSLLYPNVTINVINTGVSGDNTANGLKRFERDVLAFNPDLIVISYGLNDAFVYGDKKEEYINNLEKMILEAKKRDIEVIFITQNYMCKNISCFITDNDFKELAKNSSLIENSGLLNQYFEEARLLCKKHNVKVCDVRKSWFAMCNAGVNITELLANKLNHPIREIHDYMAIKLVETIMDV